MGMKVDQIVDRPVAVNYTIEKNWHRISAAPRQLASLKNPRADGDGGTGASHFLIPNKGTGTAGVKSGVEDGTHIDS